MLETRKAIQARRQCTDKELFRLQKDIPMTLIRHGIPELTWDIVRHQYLPLIMSAQTKPLPEFEAISAEKPPVQSSKKLGQTCQEGGEHFGERREVFWTCAPHWENHPMAPNETVRSKSGDNKHAHRYRRHRFTPSTGGGGQLYHPVDPLFSVIRDELSFHRLRLPKRIRFDRRACLATIGLGSFPRQEPGTPPAVGTDDIPTPGSGIECSIATFAALHQTVISILRIGGHFSRHDFLSLPTSAYQVQTNLLSNRYPPERQTC